MARTMRDTGTAIIDCVEDEDIRVEREETRSVLERRLVDSAGDAGRLPVPQLPQLAQESHQGPLPFVAKVVKEAKFGYLRKVQIGGGDKLVSETVLDRAYGLRFHIPDSRSADVLQGDRQRSDKGEVPRRALTAREVRRFAAKADKDIVVDGSRTNAAGAARFRSSRVVSERKHNGVTSEGTLA